MTKIGESWGPWRGCVKVSEACRFCYAERQMDRYPNNFNFKVPKKAAKATFNAPLHESGRFRKPTLIFVCPWSDFFLREADAWRDEAWGVIRTAKQHIFRICTKRPDRIQSCLPSDWPKGGYPNVWLGVSVEQNRWVTRMDELRKVDCALRWVSAEPVLEKLDLTAHLKGYSWLVSGGESGSADRIRHSDPDWFVFLRDQARKARIPYLHLQNGGAGRDKHGAYGGRVLNGKIYNEFPPLPPTIPARRLLMHTRPHRRAKPKP